MCGLYVRPSPWASGRKEIHPHIAKCAFLRLELMNHLIKIEARNFGHTEIQSVDARDLHEFLGSRADFSTWLKQQLDRARLESGRDYLVHRFVEQLPSGAKTKLGAYLTLDAAKHIAMMAGTEKGFEVREYFIECERIAKASIAPMEVPRTLSAALRLAADQAEQIEQQQAALAIAAPKVEFVDRYVDSTGNKGFRAVAKLLGANEARFREFLNDKKIMYRLGGEWTPFAQHMDTGRFVVKAGTSEKTGHAFNEAKFTPKGISWVAGQWMEWKLEQGDAA